VKVGSGRGVDSKERAEHSRRPLFILYASINVLNLWAKTRNQCKKRKCILCICTFLKYLKG